MATEIERKWLLEKLPAWISEKAERIFWISQSYVVIGESGETRVRFRRDENSGDAEYFLTVKCGEGLVRTEIEVKIDPQQYTDLKKASIGTVEKQRFVTSTNPQMEIDEYFGKLYGLYVVEIEFANQEEAEKFVAPGWFGREVTEDKAYKNKNLALKGFPKKD